MNWIKNEPSTHEPYHRSSTTDNLTTSQPTFLLTLSLTTDPQSPVLYVDISTNVHSISDPLTNISSTTVSSITIQHI